MLGEGPFCIPRPSTTLLRHVVRCRADGHVSVSSLPIGLCFKDFEVLDDDSLNLHVAGTFILDEVPPHVSRVLCFHESVRYPFSSFEEMCWWRSLCAILLDVKLTTSDSFLLLLARREQDAMSALNLETPTDASWSGVFRSSGVGYWLCDRDRAKKLALGFSSSNVKLSKRQPAVFWACVAGMRPKQVLLWQSKLLDSCPKAVELLRDLSEEGPSKSAAIARAVRAASAHRSRGDWMYAAALLAWAGDTRAAILDCVYPSGHGGDLQLSLLWATILCDRDLLTDIISRARADMKAEFGSDDADIWLSAILSGRLALANEKPLREAIKSEFGSYAGSQVEMSDLSAAPLKVLRGTFSGGQPLVGGVSPGFLELLNWM